MKDLSGARPVTILIVAWGGASVLAGLTAIALALLPLWAEVAYGVFLVLWGLLMVSGKR